MGLKIKALGMLCLLVALQTELVSAMQSSNIKVFKMNAFFQAWQGVAVDREKIYVTSDRDIHFRLSNSISVYDKKGRFLSETREAYTGTDAKGRFMSFGDCFIQNNYLYIAVYNFNAAPPENQRESRIIQYKLPDLHIVNEYQIGDGTAESLAYYKNSFWVVYHDRNKVKQFDTSFRFLRSYFLESKFGREGGYQGIFFMGDDLYANLHGSNKFNEKYAQGLDHYHFDGRTFKFVERIKPPTYGAGQGIELFNNTVYWADRPGNQIVMTPGFRLLLIEQN
ncbi:hypothetical protein [Paenibacillus tengchongensis]|uniref:hypothetical protein n=1 Tax=Paenibacillus tengchongensis TaxID=2608684 RepID=UPI00124DEFB3|nr:hypothetical protein [Paenibacillus tengchongensis]